MREVYLPTLKSLADPKWAPVCSDLDSAFKSFQLKSKEGFSRSITYAVSALQAFLQVLVHNKIGIREILTISSSKPLKSISSLQMHSV